MIIRLAGATGLAPEFLGTINNLTTSQVRPLVIAMHWFRVRSLDIGFVSGVFSRQWLVKPRMWHFVKLTK